MAAILKDKKKKDYERRGRKWGREMRREEKRHIFPPLPLFYFRPINLSLEISFNVQDGGIALFPKKKNHQSRCKIRLLCRLPDDKQHSTDSNTVVQGCLMFKTTSKTAKSQFTSCRYHAKTKTMMTVDSFSFKSTYCAFFFTFDLRILEQKT